MLNKVLANKIDHKSQALLMAIIIGGILLIGLQLTSWLSLKMLGLNNSVRPWTWLEIVSYGFVLPVLISFIVTITPVAVGYLWMQAGEKRVIAIQMILIWLAIIFLSSLGVYCFVLWEGIQFTPYPWLAYSLFNDAKLGTEAHTHLVISLLGSYSLLFITILVKPLSKNTQAEKIFGNAHFANAFEIKKAGLFNQDGIILGKAFGKIIKLPGYESALIVAPTGSGKTSAIAVPNLLTWSGSVVTNDLKGELYQLTQQHRESALNNACFLWAPADESMQGACYNPFFYVSKNPNLRIRDLQLIAEILIPATKLGDGFWYQSSREVFLTLALYLFETNGMATLSEVHDLSKQDRFFDWLEIKINRYEESFSKSLIQNANAILGADDKTQRNILKDFHSRMGLFNDPLIGYATSKNDFDFRELRRQKMSIYVHIPDADKERLSPILTLFWAQLINVMSTQEPMPNEPYGVLALMDEFGNMAKINKLKDGMSYLRSYHLRCIIIVQYLGQIVSVYGRDEAKGFLNSKVKQTFALNDLEDATFFSQAMGKKAVRVSSRSTSSGSGDRGGSNAENRSFQGRSLMTPDEIMKLDTNEGIILMESQHPIRVQKCFWFKDKQLKSLISQHG